MLEKKHESREFFKTAYCYQMRFQIDIKQNTGVNLRLTYNYSGHISESIHQKKIAYMFFTFLNKWSNTMFSSILNIFLSYLKKQKKSNIM